MPENGEVELKKGGAQIMLKGLRQRLIEYRTFPLTLKFKEAGDVVVDVLVEPRS